MSITQTEYVFVALGIQHAMRACDILLSVFCPVCNISPHYLTHVTIFVKKYIVIEHKMCVLIFSTTFV